MTPKPNSRRYWRVSAFALGVTNSAARPFVHQRSRKQEKAEEHYRALARQVGTTYERVILHQGNLGRGYAHYIHEDTGWGLFHT